MPAVVYLMHAKMIFRFGMEGKEYRYIIELINKPLTHIRKMPTFKLPVIRLKCEEFFDKTKHIISELAKDKVFTDVTLVSEDKQTIDAQRAILAYSSPYFNSILADDVLEKKVCIVHAK